MITYFHIWKRRVKPQWNISLCEKVGSYMLTPVDLDNSGKPILAKTKKANTYREAVSLLRNVKVLYTTMIVAVLDVDGNSNKIIKTYLIRGVW